MKDATTDSPAPFTVKRLAHLADPGPSAGWLIDGLWAEDAAGFIAGPPKVGKTWLALELAIAVATGTPAFGHYPVRHRGPVLLYAAEDKPSAIKERARAILTATGRGDLDKLGVGLISEPELRLDRDDDLERLRKTIQAVKPKLLILDPLVRLHRADENAAGDISRLLADIRLLQALTHVAIAIVHHVRKAQTDTPGLALRGSGDLHAWADSSLYLLQRPGGLELCPEHRSQPTPDPIPVELATEPTPHLRLRGDLRPTQALSDLERRILDVLVSAPKTRNELRDHLQIRNESLGAALQHLESLGRIERRDGRIVPVPAA
jgi:hypothetical protein